MDDDAEINGFLSKFLGEAQFERRRPRPKHSTEQLRSGLVLQGSQVTRKKPSSRRDVAFHKMLEDMANDLMENGSGVAAMPSREATPRSTSLEAAGPAVEQEILSPSQGTLLLDEVQQALDETSSDESVSEIMMDDETVKQPSPAKSQAPIAPRSPEPASPVTHISVSVVLDTGVPIFKKLKLEFDSAVVDLFTQVEDKHGRKIQALITSHGRKLERAELPIKWSGLQNGDVITALHHKHVPLEQRRLVFAESEQDIRSPKSYHQASSSKAWLDKKIPDQGPVSMGSFGDTIAGAANIEIDGATFSNNANALPNSGMVHTFAAPNRRSGASTKFDAADLPTYWRGMDTAAAGKELGNAEESEDELIDHSNGTLGDGNDSADVVDLTRASHTFSAIPIPPDVLPGEFEDFPADAWTTPSNSQAAEVLPQESAEHKLQSMRSSSSSPIKPRSVQNAVSPVPSRAAAVPTKSGIDLAVPTPPRKSNGPPKQHRLDSDELKKRQEEIQKRSDAIWANIAATLEPPAKASVSESSSRRNLLAATPSGLGTRKLLKQR